MKDYSVSFNFRLVEFFRVGWAERSMRYKIRVREKTDLQMVVRGPKMFG